MTQDEMILTLLRAVAEAMVCEKCGGTGTRIESIPGYEPGTVFNLAKGESPPITLQHVTCSCRIAVRAVLTADKVPL